MLRKITLILSVNLVLGLFSGCASQELSRSETPTLESSSGGSCEKIFSTVAPNEGSRGKTAQRDE